MKTPSPAIIGAGPAGLSAAYEMTQRGMNPVVIEKTGHVGGLSRTEEYRGYRFDAGGHRFFTKIERINRLWQDMLGEDLLKVPRKSRIYYQGRFFDYPLEFYGTFSNLGMTESLLILLSYIGIKLRPCREEETFEQWVINRFGRRLYRMFFRSYTEKVWGIPCNEIQASWAVQRIKGLSLVSVLSHILTGIPRSKSLINEFYYPVKGAGMMWQNFRERIEAGGGRVLFNAEAIGLRHERGVITGVTAQSEGKGRVEIPTSHLISSIPISRLVHLLDPGAPNEVHEAAGKLSYRALIVVGLIVDKGDLFPDQWIYVHDPKVKVGRIQNFKNWSSAMVPDPRKTGAAMEYFCNPGDADWVKSDGELIKTASRELSELGFAQTDRVIDGFVLRHANAYPVYTPGYEDHLKVIRDYLGTFENLQTVGRNGMHRYNNMDHAMLTGIMAAENVSGVRHDIWAVNEEPEYLEEDRKSKAGRLVREKVVMGAFARMDKLAFALAVGSVSGLLFFLATLWLVVKGGEVVGPNLRLLSQYFVGYTVTVSGAFIAFGYSFLWGFLFGWLFAYLRNFFLALTIYRAKKKVEILSLKDFFEHL